MSNRTAAIIGGGVIGGGWAARFLLNGWNVRVYDPSPDADRKINEMLDNARASLPQLADVAMPAEGALRRYNSMHQRLQFSGHPLPVTSPLCCRKMQPDPGR